MAKYAAPGTDGSVVTFKDRYDHFIGGEYVAAGQGPVLREPHARSPARRSPRSPAAPPRTSSARSTPPTPPRRPGARPRPPSARTSSTRSPTGWRQNLEMLAVAETWDNGKPVRETLAADIPLAIDHFRYFAGAHPRPGGLALRDRRRHRRLPLPRAARRGRADHPVELPDPDGDLEARPGAGRRQRGRAQAGRADPGVDPRARSSSSATCCRRACSTSSTASASRPASRWPRASASARSPSPARPPPAG